MYQSILNHLFLPHHLPSSAAADYLIQNKNQNEYKLLECMNEFFNSMKSATASSTLPIFPVLTNCIERWSYLQNPQNFTIENIQSIIKQLPLGSFFPLYFHAQNAAVLIETAETNVNQSFISAWQALLPTEEISSSPLIHQSCFPVTSYQLNDRSQLLSKAHCELLIDFMFNTVTYSKSHKCSREFNEIRDVPESHYVCHWWIQHFDGIKLESNSDQFTKKHRDQIRWSHALIPFRRSGLWMTMKVVTQTILIKRLGKAIGTIIYKLLITYFLTYAIYVQRSSSIELVVHCIRKIVRRLNKIDHLLSSDIKLNEMSRWIKTTRQAIEAKMNQLIPESNWQHAIRLHERKNQMPIDANFNLTDPHIYQHSCSRLKTYLNTNTYQLSSSFAGFNHDDHLMNVQHEDFIPSYDTLTKKFNYTITIALTYMEVWVESRLETWINHPSLVMKGNIRFEILLRFFEEYQTQALNHCYSEKGATDPMGYSRFILTSLSIIYCMHQKLCEEKNFERLKLHSLRIPNLLNLFEFLILPNRSDMRRARHLYFYFTEFNNKFYPDLLNSIESKDAFGVYFADRSTQMNDSIQRIRAQAEHDKQDKIIEVNTAKERYKQLMDIVNSSSCQYNIQHRHKPKKCPRCKHLKEANSIRVQVFESPLPVEQESALAVIFELQMPVEIRCYRDILWQFIHRPKPNRENQLHEWLNVPPHQTKLRPFYTASNNYKVKLLSSMKSLIQSHYSTPPSIVSTPVSGFLFENSLKVQITPVKPIDFVDECRILTPQLTHPDYKSLQFTIDTTQFAQNQVIARLSQFSPRLKSTQLIEFGSFRSGHRLQWWNLLTILEMDSLSLAEESVAILILHSILQYGPLISDCKTSISSNFLYPESHHQLLDDHFIDELISRLDHHLDDCESNWQNELVLVVITMIAVRIFSICNPTRENQVTNLILKCRQIGEKWIELIAETIRTTKLPLAFEEIIKLRLKIVHIGISCILTFSADKNRMHHLLSSNEHMVSLLKAITTVHDNIILNKDHSDMSQLMSNMMRFSERILLIIQPIIAELLHKTSYQSLNDFTVIYWAVMKRKGCMNGQWKKRRQDVYDGWYDCQYESKYISIDCLRGSFLIDGMTISFLPEKITSNEVFTRVFGTYVFEVQTADLPNTYITKNTYHENGQVQYEFHFNDQTNRLIITERHMKSNERFQLIPHQCFENELSDFFVSNHSHWWNSTASTIDFRPVRFKEKDFLTNTPYSLTINKGYLVANDTTDQQILLNQTSTFFQGLFQRYFRRLDDQPYVYMIFENATIHIHLSRLQIAFQYNSGTQIITSREYSDMCIDEDQWLGTLTGLTSGLLLSPLPIKGQKLEHYPYKKLIVPFGKISTETSPNSHHQTVTIERASSILPLDQYFLFILNDRLRILQSTNSPTGWLYLALLHAKTSHPLPDEYTGMTGMERAFQLLNSAGCWSDQSYDLLSLDILSQIATISPKVNFYPEHLSCMIDIDWSSNSLPYSMQHFGYYLIAKQLIANSQQLNFMHSSSISNEIPKVFEEKEYNEVLLKKLYWDYRDSYNPITRLPSSIEEKIQSTFKSRSYEIVPRPCLPTISSSTLDVMTMYQQGNVTFRDCSNENWLPLGQWLADENQLKIIWIGLLKKLDRIRTQTSGKYTDDIARFAYLLDFLHYISSKPLVDQFHLEVLKTASHMTSIWSTDAFRTFPPFIGYCNIEEISVMRKRLNLSNLHSLDVQNQIVQEVESSLENKTGYVDHANLLTFVEKERINQLLTSWQNNRQLRYFLRTIQTLLNSVPVQQLNTKPTYIRQRFTYQSLQDHYEIHLQTTAKSIDEKLLANAKQKFQQLNPNQLIKSLSSVNQRGNVFPHQLFSSTNNFNEIGSYFKNQLQQSWSNLHSRVEPQTEILELLDHLRKESRLCWDELVQSIRKSNEHLFAIGLLSRIVPVMVISSMQQNNLSADEHTLLGGLLVNWTFQQQLERALHFVFHEKWDDFLTEISHTPHSNWIPSEHLSWLILELEMNITIREIQINVARHMIQPDMSKDDEAKVRNIVMQMNMGEGKTSVILPMLAVSLASSDATLVRIVVLKSLFPTNYRSLKYKLGGLLNRRIFSFSCRREMNFNNEQINQISCRLKEALHNCDVILTSPEDILSFDLLTIDQCRRMEYDISCSMLSIQRWVKKYTRDILDESDEILHVKYQLIYTVGNQIQVDGGSERWRTIQSVLELAKKSAESVWKQFPEEVTYKRSERKSVFPEFRLQSAKPFTFLCQLIAEDWLNQRSYRSEDRKLLLSFILKADQSIDDLPNEMPWNELQLFLILRGLLSSEVLFVALKKRHRVNYGITTNPSFDRLMAVPFRAKDVAADRTEFGHPDVAIVLTQLSYYYSGLDDSQLQRCFDRLNEKENDPALVYEQWILYEDQSQISASIKQWKSINLKDYYQRTQILFPTLKSNMLVINYFLNHFVFPREAKQFAHKLVASAWDLSSSMRTKIITGFSGTNDTQLLLPVHIRQYDLPELQKTDAIVINNLLKPENGNYQTLSINASTNEILNQICNSKEKTNVILDVGALFIDGANRDIATQWLNLSSKTQIDYAVYFDSDSIVVCNRQYHEQRFETSPASERLDRCVFYLDEIHTRGTDFKFPNGFKAAVTLGNALTKDRFVQACMRMRKLGNGHSLSFWSSDEAHQQILQLTTANGIKVIDILRWVYENTQQATWDGLHHWAAQSLHYQRKMHAFRNIQWGNQAQKFTNQMIQQLAEECLEPEIIELKHMYGSAKVLQTVENVYSSRYQQCHQRVSTEIHEIVLKRLHDYGGTNRRLCQLLDDEQQRELEHELEEERQSTQPLPAKPCSPTLHEEIKRLCDTNNKVMDLTKLPNVFRPLPCAFTDTTLVCICQANSWQPNLWISAEFLRVIETKGERLNAYLRPPRWIVVYRNQHIIFLSAFEANWLMGRLNFLCQEQKPTDSLKMTLRLLLPRIKRNQSIFVNTATLTIPSFAPCSIPIEWLVQLFIFNGTLYFETVDEQTAYCQCLGLCPKPRTSAQQEAFEKEWIAIDGFVRDANHRHFLSIQHTRFLSNPLTFVKQLIETRNNLNLPISSHVGSIISNSTKLL